MLSSRASDKQVQNEDLIRKLLSEAHQPAGGLPRGTSHEVLREFTKRTGVQIPNELQEWLLISNGPLVGPGGFYGVRPLAGDYVDIEAAFGSFPDWKTRGWIPIAGDGCGSYYIMVTHGEYGPGFPVIFCDHANGFGPTYIVASNLGRFIEFMLREELGEYWWPFDRDRFIQEDPAILSFHGIPLPWECE